MLAPRLDALVAALELLDVCRPDDLVEVESAAAVVLGDADRMQRGRDIARNEAEGKATCARSIIDSKRVPSGRHTGRAPDHGRFAPSPSAIVAVVVVVVISCRASTGQSIGSHMTWDFVRIVAHPWR